jgi:hypothetical protein
VVLGQVLKLDEAARPICRAVPRRKTGTMPRARPSAQTALSIAWYLRTENFASWRRRSSTHSSGFGAFSSAPPLSFAEGVGFQSFSAAIVSSAPRNWDFPTP